jgi:hypothetical protein
MKTEHNFKNFTNQNEIIVKVGSEGGSITLFGLRSGNNWVFSLNVIDQSMLIIDESSIESDSKLVNSWAEAITLLDKYPWRKLHPLHVHPEFYELLIEDVIANCKLDGHDDSWEVASWKSIYQFVNKK